MANSETNVRAVDRSLQILDCYTSGKTGFSLVELARAIGLSPSTTLRLLTTLEKNNYLYRNPENMRYYLGYKLVQIGHSAFVNLDIRAIAHPYIEQLVEIYDESAGLYLLQGTKRVCVDRVEGTKALRRVIQIGAVYTLTRGAAGRVLLAHLPEKVMEELLREDPFTTARELAEVRRLGYAVSYGEREEGLVSVAAPIFNADGKAVAALFISSPRSRVDQEIVVRQRMDVVERAVRVSDQLGYMDEL